MDRDQSKPSKFLVVFQIANARSRSDIGMAPTLSKDGLTLIHNAKIYAFDEADYEWMLFDRHSGYIKAVGREDPPISEPTPDDVIDLGGRRILPGLHESHIHLGCYGLTLADFDASGCQSVEELKDCLLTFAKNNPDKKWIHGRGWEQDRLGRYPDKTDLDSVCPDRPVLIFRVCGHIAVANSKALLLAGITKQTPYPEGGHIDRYPVGHSLSGEPTGIIREVAEQLFKEFLTPTESDLLSAVKESIRHCLKNGVTSVHALEDNHTWDILCSLADQDQLPIRVFYVLFWENRKKQNTPEAGQCKGKLLSCDRVKIFSDGALGGCTAALSVPYKGSANNKGLLLHTQEQLNNLVSEATSCGYRLEIHAIGDAAADAVLTSLEEEKIAPEKRPIMVHCQILRKDLIKRMNSLGVIASIQPQFVPTDSRWIGDVLPEELMEYAYAWKTLFNNNVQCCGGSDAPVESPQPLRGIYDAIFRYMDESCKTSYRPEERLSTKQAISLYTKGGAYATRREHDLGQLLPGFQADFIVLDSDPVQYPEEFRTAHVIQVWVAGVQRI